MCRQSHTTCLIDPDTDNRRRNLLLQRISTLENMITNILETVRDEEKSERFISIVRSNASFDLAGFSAKPRQRHIPRNQHKT
jgi:hypothetical protein